MSIGDLFHEIEGHEFMARINIASGLRTALRAISEEEVVRGLRQEIEHPQVAQRVLWRVFEITHRGVDVRYENPYDSALFVYALVLLEHDPRLAYIAAGAISRLPNLWWSGDIASAILADRIHRNRDAGVMRLQFPAPGVAGPEVAFELPPVSFVAGDRVFVSDVQETVIGRALSAQYTIAFGSSTHALIQTLEVFGHSISHTQPAGAAHDRVFDMTTR
jgi:hypothetical protein